MTPDLSALASAWRDRASELERFAPAAATAFLDAAADLSAALGRVEAELLTPDEAARYSGYSRRRLAELRAAGTLPNHGTDARPRYRRVDLPVKAGTR